MAKKNGKNRHDSHYNKAEDLLPLLPDDHHSRVRWLIGILNSIHEGVLVVDVSSTTRTPTLPTRATSASRWPGF